MDIKKHLQKVIKEHKVMRESLIKKSLMDIESISDKNFSIMTKKIFGTSLSKEQFKENVSEGEYSIEELQKLEEECTMKRMRESDEAEGEHKYPDSGNVKPVQPSQAGAGVKGETNNEEVDTTPPVKGDNATDGSDGEHKYESVGDEDEEYSEEVVLDDPTPSGTDDYENKIQKLEQIEKEQNELKEAIENDLLELVQDLVSKIKELEAKIMGVGSEEPETEMTEADVEEVSEVEEPQEEMTENVDEEELDENVEPQPPITQEGIHGAKPIHKKKKESVDIARSVGQTFFKRTLR